MNEQFDRVRVFIFCCLVFFVVWAFRVLFFLLFGRGRVFFGCLGVGVFFFCCLGEGVFFFWLLGPGACVCVCARARVCVCVCFFFLSLFGRGTGVHSLTRLPGSSLSDPTTKETEQQKKTRVPNLIVHVCKLCASASTSAVALSCPPPHGFEQLLRTGLLTLHVFPSSVSRSHFKHKRRSMSSYEYILHPATL